MYYIFMDYQIPGIRLLFSALLGNCQKPPEAVFSISMYAKREVINHPETGKDEVMGTL